MSYQQGSKKPGAAPYPQQQYYLPPQHGGAPYPPTSSHVSNITPYPPNPSKNTGFDLNVPMEMPKPLNIPVYPPGGSGNYPPSSRSYPLSTSTVSMPFNGASYPSSGDYPLQTSFGSNLPPTSTYPPHTRFEGYPSSSTVYPTCNGGGYQPQTTNAGYPPSRPLPSPKGYPPSRPAPGAPPGGPRYQGPNGLSEGANQSASAYGGHNYKAVYQPPKRTPTVRPANPFDPRNDAEALRAAMKGWGCDDKALVNILTHRCNVQRLQIEKEYKVLFGRDLVEDLKSETKGNLETLLVAMVTPLPVYYAKELHHAMAGLGTDESVLIEILCTKSNAEIMTIRKAYHALYNTSLERDLKGDTGGHFKRLMVALCNAARDESMVTNPVAAQKDAEDLLNAGENRIGTDESTFNMVLCQRNWAQLQLIFQEYQKLTGHDIEQAIKEEFSGDIERGLLAVIRSIKNQAAFFAKLLNESMKGLGTKDRSLIRLVVTRSEIDMVEIKREYEARYGETLADAIKGDTSGHYKKCLLALIGED